VGHFYSGANNAKYALPSDTRSNRLPGSSNPL
jgi:hypothetical protein